MPCNLIKNKNKQFCFQKKWVFKDCGVNKVWRAGHANARTWVSSSEPMENGKRNPNTGEAEINWSLAIHLHQQGQSTERLCFPKQGEPYLNKDTDS